MHEKPGLQRLELGVKRPITENNAPLFVGGKVDMLQNGFIELKVGSFKMSLACTESHSAFWLDLCNLT